LLFALGGTQVSAADVLTFHDFDNIHYKYFKPGIDWLVDG
jgi:hypothetical protein